MANETVDLMNSFLRGEISAVETYRQALDKIDNPGATRSLLQQCMQSHQQRVDTLRTQVQRLGGSPAQGSGPWGAFAKLVEGGAKLFGEKAAIAALEEGEDHGRDDYRRDVAKLAGEARTFVTTNIMPEQERTHRALSDLKRSLS
jgi:demethoxyubiquinone hydroxylase (CLK1/Coq7/Cat5 family)